MKQKWNFQKIRTGLLKNKHMKKFKTQQTEGLSEKVEEISQKVEPKEQRKWRGATQISQENFPDLNPELLKLKGTTKWKSKK